MPHFQVVVGGQWKSNAGSFGLATLPVPSKRIPEVVEKLTALYTNEREDESETFVAWVGRVGKARIREELLELADVPPPDVAPEAYSDWGDARTYSLDDHGTGECAGEVVPIAEFGLQNAEREVFEAQLDLESGRVTSAAEKAYRSMLTAAATLVKTEYLDLPDEPDTIVEEFRTRFYDTQKFFDPFAKGKFANYLFRAHAESARAHPQGARQRVEEAQLFIEAAYAAYERSARRTAG